MGQLDILLALKNNPNEWYSAKDLVSIVGQEETLIRVKLKKLAKFKYVEAKKTSEIVDVIREQTINKQLNGPLVKVRTYQIVYRYLGDKK